MDEIKNTVAKNITELRLMNNMTQLELAEKLNYSNKTVSKWERAESSPDIAVLVEIADLFGVSLDYLVRAENADLSPLKNTRAEEKYNRRVITYLSESAVWFVSISAFILTTLITGKATFQWLYFAYSLPISIIVKLVFNSIWFNPRRNYLIISALTWSVLAALHVSFLYFGKNISLIYILGFVGQAVIVLWSFVKKPKA